MFKLFVALHQLFCWFLFGYKTRVGQKAGTSYLVVRKLYFSEGRIQSCYWSTILCWPFVVCCCYSGFRQQCCVLKKNDSSGRSYSIAVCVLVFWVIYSIQSKRVKACSFICKLRWYCHIIKWGEWITNFTCCNPNNSMHLHLFMCGRNNLYFFNQNEDKTYLCI